MSSLVVGCGGDRARTQAELERRAQPPAQPAVPVAASTREDPPPPPDWTDVAALASAVATFVARESVLKDRPFTVADAAGEVALVLQTQLTDTVYVISDDEAHLLAEADASGVPAIVDFALGPAPGGGVLVTGATLMQLGDEARYAYTQDGERWVRRPTGGLA